MDNDRLLAIWRHLLSVTEDRERLATRMKVDLELWDTFRGVRGECLGMWLEMKAVDR